MTTVPVKPAAAQTPGALLRLTPFSDGAVHWAVAIVTVPLVAVTGPVGYVTVSVAV